MRKLLLIATMLFGMASGYAQTDMTDRIANPSFEDKLNGWENEGMQSQSNSVFKLKEGSIYAEKWTGRGGKVGNASLLQKVANLPAGTYTVTVAAQNIQEDTPTAVQTGVYVVANGDKTSINVANQYSVTTTIVDGCITLGVSLSGATGNYVCVDNFRLTQEEPTAETFTTMHALMQAVVDEADGVNQHVVSPEQTELDAATDGVKALISQDVTDGVTEAVVRLQRAIYDYSLSMASEDNPIVMTDLIVNPSFENNGSKGWVNEGMAAQTNSSFTMKAGNTYMEIWTWKGNSVDDVTLSQLVKMPNGLYRVSAAAQNIQQDTPTKQFDGAFLFASNRKTSVGVCGNYSLDFVVIEGKTNIGFMTRKAGGNYICVDNFSLEYLGRSEDMLMNELADRTAGAQALANQKMNGAVLQALTDAIANAQALTTPAGIEAVADALNNAIAAAEASIADYAVLKVVLDEANELLATNPAEGAAELKAATDEAQGIYDAAEVEAAGTKAAATALAGAVLTCRVANGTGPVPVVTAQPFMPMGATAALGRAEATGSHIIEQGFCWATHPNPTVADNRSTKYYNQNGKIFELSPLEPATCYYVRAYAMTSTYAVGYGEEKRIFTLPKGECTWWYNNGGSADENARINKAIEESIDLYNTWTSIKGFHISCSYGSGTPTADCSYGGGMRVGPNQSYQRTGTLLHESNHGVGVGTSGRWWNTDLHSGKWYGWRATQMVRFFDDSSTSMIAGDDMHMWPYGINGAHEDDGRWISYIANVLITHALHQDGLVAVAGKGAAPAYSFEYTDDEKYYITNENSTCAPGKGYLYETGTGELAWQEASGNELVTDDIYAWQFEYIPATSYYRIRNAKTGHYFSYSGSRISTAEKAVPGANESFMMMIGRSDVTVGDKKTVTKKGYWIQAGTGNDTPTSLSAQSTGAVGGASFDLGNTASRQRWLILTADEATAVAGASAEVHIANLRKLLAGAKAMVDVAHEDQTENATEAMQATISDIDSRVDFMTGISEAKTAINDIQTAIRTFVESAYPTDINKPYDLTFLIVDNDLATFDDWDFNDLPEPTTTDGIGESKGTKFKLSQTISDMPAGIYQLRAQAFHRPDAIEQTYEQWLAGTDNAKTYIYGNSIVNKTVVANIVRDAQPSPMGGSEQKAGELYVPNDAIAVANYFSQGLYDNNVTFKQSKRYELTIGISNVSSKFADDDWSAFTNFRLYNYGNKFTKAEVAEATAITDIAFDDNKQPAVVYDLTGRPISAPTKGVYIINGKKIVVK